MTDEPNRMLMCLRIADANPNDNYRARGGVQGNCSECDAPVWISKGGQETMVRVGARIICIPCANLRSSPDRSAGIMTPEVAADLASQGINPEAASKRFASYYGIQVKPET